MIKINNLQKTFNKNRSNEVKALKGINLELPDSGLIAIFGKSGSGKTTFMNMLGGLDNYTDGSIEFDDKTYTKSVDDKFRIENIGYIFQNYCLDVKVNVYENVARGLRTIGVKDEEEIFSRVMVALENVGMRDYFKRSIDTLSGGQQQRVAIARAMVKGAKIILADEPTGNLDEINTKTVMDLLKEMSKTCLVILVTHEQDLIEKYADRIIEISDGQIGKSYEVQSSEGHLEDKTKIFLGGKTKKEVKAEDNIKLQIYGEVPSVNIMIVNDDGKLYLACDNKELRFVDDKAEIKFLSKTKEEYFEEQKQKTQVAIKDLGPVKAQKTGSVFSFKESFVSGLKNVFSVKKKKMTIFAVAIMVFVIALVFLIGGFGASLYKYNNVGANINPDLITMYVGDAKTIKEVEEIGQKYGYQNSYYRGDNNRIQIEIEGFETFQNMNSEYDSHIGFHDDLKNKTWLVGDKDQNLGIYDIVISKGLADKIMSDWKINFGIANLPYDMLLLTDAMLFNTMNIKGVVEGKKSFVYIDRAYYFTRQFSFSINGLSYILDLDIEHGVEAKDGEILIPIDEEIFGTTETTEIFGKEYKLTPNDQIDDICINKNEMIGISQRFTSKYGTLYIFADDAENLANELREKYRNTITGDSITSKETQIAREKSMEQSNMIYNGVASLVVFVIMIIAVFFLMYSSLVSQIKEIGVYRATGVSKKNILFKFMIEGFAFVLVSVISIFMLIGLPATIFIKSAFVIYFYPWLFVASFVVVSCIIWLISILPVAFFLRKSPIKILSRYDL